LNGHLEAVKLLIEAGGDITIFNKAGHDAVFEAEITTRRR
jgi:ankyrin repeat protein